MKNSNYWNTQGNKFLHCHGINFSLGLNSFFIPLAHDDVSLTIIAAAGAIDIRMETERGEIYAKSFKSFLSSPMAAVVIAAITQ